MPTFFSLNWNRAPSTTVHILISMNIINQLSIVTTAGQSALHEHISTIQINMGSDRKYMGGWIRMNTHDRLRNFKNDNSSHQLIYVLTNNSSGWWISNTSINNDKMALIVVLRVCFQTALSQMFIYGFTMSPAAFFENFIQLYNFCEYAVVT